MTEKIFIPFARLEEFNEVSRKDVNYDDIIKSHKNQGFTVCLENIFLERPQKSGGGGGGGVLIDPRPSHLRVKIT